MYIIGLRVDRTAPKFGGSKRTTICPTQLACVSTCRRADLSTVWLSRLSQLAPRSSHATCWNPMSRV